MDVFCWNFTIFYNFFNLEEKNKINFPSKLFRGILVTLKQKHIKQYFIILNANYFSHLSYGKLCCFSHWCIKISCCFTVRFISTHSKYIIYVLYVYAVIASHDLKILCILHGRGLLPLSASVINF